MSKRFGGEAGPSPESTEDQKYAALQAALTEQKRILKETEDVLNVPPEERGANEDKLKGLGRQADEASKNFGKAVEEYIAAVDEAHEREKEE